MAIKLALSRLATIRCGTTFVVMHDGSGNPTGKRQQLAAGEDPSGVAYRLTRESWKAKAPDFNRRLDYQPLGML